MLVEISHTRTAASLVRFIPFPPEAISEVLTGRYVIAKVRGVAGGAARKTVSIRGEDEESILDAAFEDEKDTIS
jgi:hypothetical protein